VLTGLRRTADCLRRGFRLERAREEGLAELVEVLGWQDEGALAALWGRTCDAFDRTRNGG
jgi:hypothetical protein